MTRIQRLRAIWAELNRDYFAHKLSPVPIRVTRSRCTYGYFSVTEGSDAPLMRISSVMCTSDAVIRDTMKHEMIHQALWELGDKKWHEHGEAFQREHVRIFGHHYVEEN